MKRWVIGLIAAALAAWAGMPMAQVPAAGPLESTLEARKVERAADGSERYAPAETARPGDVIEYIATYRNAGAQPLRNVEATLPIPEGTEFLPGSARPGPDKVSADGLTYGSQPLRRTVRRDGKDAVETVPAREYRFLRWKGIDLAPSRTVAYVARVKVREAR